MAEPTLRQASEKRMEEIHAGAAERVEKDEDRDLILLSTLVAFAEVQTNILLSIDEELAGLREERNQE